jgi:hypothetical protein
MAAAHGCAGTVEPGRSLNAPANRVREADIDGTVRPGILRDFFGRLSCADDQVSITPDRFFSTDPKC